MSVVSPFAADLKQPEKNVNKSLTIYRQRIRFSRTTNRVRGRGMMGKPRLDAALGPIVSSAHLASGAMPALSELEFGLILLGHAFERWMVRCAAAAGVRRPLRARRARAAHHRPSLAAQARRRHLPRAQYRGHPSCHLFAQKTRRPQAFDQRPARQRKDRQPDRQGQGDRATIPQNPRRAAGAGRSRAPAPTSAGCRKSPA